MIGAKTITPLWSVSDGSNCTSLKHFFKCLETSGLDMSDSKGGVVYRPSAIASDSTTGTLLFNNNAVHPKVGTGFIPLHRGTWAQIPAGASVVNFAVFRDTGDLDGNLDPLCTRFPVGRAAASYANLSLSFAGSMHAIISDGTTSVSTSPSGTGTTGTLVSGTTYAAWTQYNGAAGTGALKGVCKVSPIAAITPWADVYRRQENVAVPYAAFTPAPFTRCGGAEFYGWAVFHFTDGLPSDLETGLEWMAAEWLRGNKSIWPYWD